MGWGWGGRYLSVCNKKFTNREHESDTRTHDGGETLAAARGPLITAAHQRGRERGGCRTTQDHNKAASLERKLRGRSESRQETVTFRHKVASGEIPKLRNACERHLLPFHFMLFVAAVQQMLDRRVLQQNTTALRCGSFPHHPR